MQRSSTRGIAPTSKERRDWLNRCKDRPCEDCGNRFPPQSMDFDHREPELKRFTIARATVKAEKIAWTPGRRRRVRNTKERQVTWAELRAEVAKCDVVCANCHRLRTQKRHRLRQIDQAYKRLGRASPNQT